MKKIKKIIFILTPIIFFLLIVIFYLKKEQRDKIKDYPQDIQQSIINEEYIENSKGNENDIFDNVNNNGNNNNDINKDFNNNDKNNHYKNDNDNKEQDDSNDNNNKEDDNKNSNIKEDNIIVLPSRFSPLEDKLMIEEEGYKEMGMSKIVGVIEIIKSQDAAKKEELEKEYPLSYVSNFELQTVMNELNELLYYPGYSITSYYYNNEPVKFIKNHKENLPPYFIDKKGNKYILINFSSLTAPNESIAYVYTEKDYRKIYGE